MNLSLSEKFDFEELSLEIFQRQCKENPIYNSYISELRVRPDRIQSCAKIPFLPIQAFKKHKVQTGIWDPSCVFTSSGTSGQNLSSHYIDHVDRYLTLAETIFTSFFAPLSNFHLLALLPTYTERRGSSLISMIRHFIKKTEHPSGFYSDHHNELINEIEQLKHSKKKVILWGTPFALCNLAEKGHFDWKHCLIIETGGMKGHGSEPVRTELHAYLSTKFGTPDISSEYGMTELYSQAYALKNGLFQCPKTMKILIRDLTDPFTYVPNGTAGGINIIDLANHHSCAFIETQDVGILRDPDHFEVMGRIDNSELRGCNMMT